MIEFGGVLYYFDVDSLENIIKLKGTSDSDKIVDTTTTTHLDAEGKVTHSEVVETVS